MSKAKARSKLKADTLVAGVVEAVEQFLQYSCNPSFLHSCLQLLQASSTEEAKDHLAAHVWALLHRRLGAPVPGDVVHKLEVSGLLSHEELAQLRRNQEDHGGSQHSTQNIDSCSQNTHDFFAFSQHSQEICAPQLGSRFVDEVLPLNPSRRTLQEERDILCLRSIPAQPSNVSLRANEDQLQIMEISHPYPETSTLAQQRPNLGLQASQGPIACGASSSQLLSLFQTPESQEQLSADNHLPRNCTAEIPSPSTQTSDFFFRSQEMECRIEFNAAASTNINQNYLEGTNSQENDPEFKHIQPSNPFALLTPPGSQNLVSPQPLSVANEEIQNLNVTILLDGDKTIFIGDSSIENNNEDAESVPDVPAAGQRTLVEPLSDVESLSNSARATERLFTTEQNYVTDDSVEVTSMYEVCSNQNASGNDPDDVILEARSVGPSANGPNLLKSSQSSRPVVRIARSAPLFSVGHAAADTTSDSSASGESRAQEVSIGVEPKENSDFTDEEIFMKRENSMLKSMSTAKADGDPGARSHLRVNSIAFGNLDRKYENNNDGGKEETRQWSPKTKRCSLDNMLSSLSEQTSSQTLNAEFYVALDSPIRRSTNYSSMIFSHRIFANETCDGNDDSNDDGSTLEEIFENISCTNITKNADIQVNLNRQGPECKEATCIADANNEYEVSVDEHNKSRVSCSQKSVHEAIIRCPEDETRCEQSTPTLAFTEFTNFKRRALAAEFPSRQITPRTHPANDTDAPEWIETRKEAGFKNGIARKEGQKSLCSSHEHDFFHDTFSSSSPSFDVSVTDALRSLDSPMFGRSCAVQEDGNTTKNGSSEEIFCQSSNRETSFRTATNNTRLSYESRAKNSSPKNSYENNIFTSTSPILSKCTNNSAKLNSMKLDIGLNNRRTNYNEVDFFTEKLLLNNEDSNDSRELKCGIDRDWFTDTPKSLHLDASDLEREAQRTSAAGRLETEAQGLGMEPNTVQRENTKKNDEWQLLFEGENSIQSHSCLDTMSTFSSHNDSNHALQFRQGNYSSTSPNLSDCSTEEIWGARFVPNHDTSDISSAFGKYSTSQSKSKTINVDSCYNEGQPLDNTMPGTRGCSLRADIHAEQGPQNVHGANCFSERPSNLTNSSFDSVQSQSLLDNVIFDPFL